MPEKEFTLDPTRPEALIGAVLAGAFFNSRLSAVLQKQPLSDKQARDEVVEMWFAFSELASGQ